MNSEFDSSTPIENYIDINSHLPENFLDMVDQRLSYLTKNYSDETTINEELGYLASAGSIGWWWQHELRDHYAPNEKTKQEYSLEIAKFAALEAYITTNATKEGALKAGEYLLKAATAHDGIEDNKKPDKDYLEQLWTTEVTQNLENYFIACGFEPELGKEMGNHRSDWWLYHHKKEYPKAGEAYAQELKKILGINGSTQKIKEYKCTKKICKENIIKTIQLHDGKVDSWQNDAQELFYEFWKVLFNIRDDYTLPYNR